MRSPRRLAAALGAGLLIGVLASAVSAMAPASKLALPPAFAEPTETPGAVYDTPTDKGPIGLLAIIATVCVVGVTVGAIRAIVGQRATRADFV